MNSGKLPHDHGQDIEAHLEDLPDSEVFQAAAGMFRLLDDGNRVRIFWILCHCEECVINLSSLMEMSSPAVSHHLRQLKAGGLIVSRRSGAEVYDKAADTPQAQLLHQIIEQVVEISCPGC